MSQSQYPSSFDLDGLLASGRGELFGPGNAQLPAPPMLMFDRIVTISTDGGNYGKGYIEAELDIRPDLWFFQCHFIGDPVMPGCLGLDAMWQMGGFYLGWRVINRKLVMGIADGVLEAYGEVIYTCNDMRVGLFGATAEKTEA